MQDPDRYSQFEPEYKQLMKGVSLALTAFALGMGSAPLVETMPAESAQWLMLAAMSVVAYGMFLAADSIAPLLEGIEAYYRGDIE